jgi:hypothetical protein
MALKSSMELTSMPPRHIRWRSTLLLLAAVLLALFSVAGWVMAADLQGPGYQTAALIHLLMLAVSIAAIIVILIWRRRRRDTPRSAV